MVQLSYKIVSHALCNIFFYCVGYNLHYHNCFFFSFYFKRHRWKKKFVPIIVFFIQIILNLIWPPIFFIANSLIFLFIIILLLTITIGLNIILFWKHSKIAACFLIPYFLWLIFANYLNFELIKLNMF